MKVLWFTNSPCSSIKRNNGKTLSGGWLTSLENALKCEEDINLSIAFISNSEKDPFIFEGTTYYPILDKAPQNPIKKIINRIKPLSQKEEKLLPSMLHIIQQCQPDIIHIHGTEECFGLIAEHITTIPIVFSIQGLIAPYREKIFSGLSYYDIKKHEGWYNKLKMTSIKEDFQSFIYRGERECKYLKKASYIMGRTFWDKDITFLLNPNRKYFIVNEILRDEFYTTQWEKSAFENELQIVSILSLGVYKGMETILKAVQLLTNYANFKFTWHIIGYEPHTPILQITEKILSLNHQDYNIKLHGRLDAQQIANLFKTSDIYCHVSHIENSPNSVCEAMIMGMPIIASYAGGTSSLLEHEKDGLLIQDGDPYILAGAICNLQKDFKKAQQYGLNAQAKATLRHNPKNIVRELLYAYKEIVNLK